MNDPVWQPLFGYGMDGLVGLLSLPQSFWMVNVTTYVTTILTAVDDFLSWRTQFTGFVIIYQLYGMLNGSIFHPPLHLPMPHGMYSLIRPIATDFGSISYFVLSYLLLSPKTPSVRNGTYHICFLFGDVLSLD